MKLSIIDTEKMMQYQVNWVELNTVEGNMVIQEQHVPMIIELANHKELLFELESGTTQSLMMKDAIAHVTRLEVKILVSLAV